MVGMPKSCTACRQSKMACDSRIKAPAACSRCTSRNLECCFDRNFKRMRTRKIVQEITSQHTVTTNTLEKPLEKSPVADSLPVFFGSIDSTEIPDFHLGSVCISSQVAVELLRHFGQHYYVHAPFVEPIRSLTEFSSVNPLLLWTILLVASQNHEQHGNLYEQIFLPHRELLAQLSHTAVRTIEEIHAILLLCLWPIPKEGLFLDPSWSYIGIAINNGMRINLHRPIREDPIAYAWAGNSSTQSQRLTWLSCFSISTLLATFLGFVPPISSYNQLKYIKELAIQLENLPPGYRAELALYDVICNYTVSLEDIHDASTYLLLTQTFDGALDSIKGNYLTAWTPELEILLEYARINLYSLATTMTFQEEHRRQKILVRGLESACRLISNVKSGISPQSRLQYYPRHLFSKMFGAVIFLFRLFVSNPSSDQTQKSLATGGINEAHEIYRSLSRNRGMAITAKFMGKLKELPTSQLFPAKLIVTNRLGASLLCDTIIRMHRRARHEPRQSTVDDGLPLAPEMKGGVCDPFLSSSDGISTTLWSSWDEMGFDLNLWDLEPHT